MNERSIEIGKNVNIKNQSLVLQRARGEENIATGVPPREELLTTWERSLEADFCGSDDRTFQKNAENRLSGFR